MVIKMYYLNYFFVYAILGHLIETIFVPNFNSGILYGWWTPVYGFGVILILLIGKIIDRFNWKDRKLLKILTTYLCSMILLSIIELSGGYIIELIWNTKLWDYSNHRFHIGTFISLEMANVWGITSILVLYFLKSITDKIVCSIPKYITYLFVILFFIDMMFTIILK